MRRKYVCCTCDNVSPARPQPAVLIAIHPCNTLAYRASWIDWAYSILIGVSIIAPSANTHLWLLLVFRTTTADCLPRYLTGFVPSPPGKRTEEAPEARRSAKALDA